MDWQTLLALLPGLLGLIGLLLWWAIRQAHERGQAELGRALEAQHRALLESLRAGLMDQGERVARSLSESAAQTQGLLGRELRETRAALYALQSSQAEALGVQREALLRQLAELQAAVLGRQDRMRSELLERLLTGLAEEGRAQQAAVRAGTEGAARLLGERMDALTQAITAQLEQISGRVAERLDAGFKQTNETFANVMARLAVIDEAQKKIDGLTTNVVSLQELLGDKRARGAFGETQLAALVENLLPAASFAFQHSFSTGVRVDCALFLPDPTGTVAVDSKFPLENYRRLREALSETERQSAQRQFKGDIKKHIDDICRKYIIPDETGEGALMFVPAEAVFAEIHARHGELVSYAQERRVWIASPTTLMAILNTARAVLKDVEMRKHVRVMRRELGLLAQEFGRFDQRMQKLAEHIRLAHEDAEEVHTTSRKISQRFRKIEAVELSIVEAAPVAPLPAPDPPA